MTVLVWAARNNNVEAVRALLLAAPQLVNVPEEKSLSTPLHYACHRGFLSTVNQLLAAGADVKMRDAGGLTPLLKALSTTSPPQDSLKVIGVVSFFFFALCDGLSTGNLLPAE